MRPIDERLFRWLYGRYPKIGTLYYAIRQPILIVLLACLGLLLAVPCGIVGGIVCLISTIVNEISEPVRVAAYRFKRYIDTTRLLWRVAAIKIDGGAK